MSTRTHELITDRIVALLEQGTVPWHKPWKARTGLPRNLVSKKPYRGVNVLLLLAMSYESPFWLTFHQASELGGTIRKGEHACPVVFWKRLTLPGDTPDEKRDIPLLRYYHVFNLAQCDGLESPSAGTVPESPSVTGNSITLAERIVAGMPQPPVVKHGFAQAFYAPREDTVCLPNRERFEGGEHYFSALYHELVHSTGHESRLKRATLSPQAGFGSDPYCKEELIAEIGAAFLCGQAEIIDRTIDNSAAYLGGWLEKFKHDKALIVQAAAQAQKAVDFILDRHPESEVPHD